MYKEIFDEVVEIIHNDYAGCQDKEGWDHPNNYRESIINMEYKNGITDTKFVEMIQDYLLDLKDPHVVFRLAEGAAPKLDVGFSVRRYKDRLYVTATDQEHRLSVGDVIVSLDENSILDLAEKYRRNLMESPADREKWNKLLPQFHNADLVDRNGETRSVKLTNYEKPDPIPEYTMNAMGSDTLILKMTDFMYPDAISNLLKENEDELSQRKNLIIDVRVNRGGVDTAYFSLLPYLFTGNQVDLSNDEDTMLTLCTERNVDLRIQTFQKMFGGLNDQQTKDMTRIFINELEKHRGEGFAELDLSELEGDMKINTKLGPERVIVLTDVYCGSSGDSFAEVLKKSSKVTVVGRATAGMNDYSNVAIKNWADRFEFGYPTSRLTAIDRGKGMTGVGIKPDVYIPWTPKHLEEDVDLKKALTLLKDLQ